MITLVRRMQLTDIPQVSDIEREAFPPPWPATNFRRDLTVNTSTHYLVACEELPESERQITGLGDPPADSRPRGSILPAVRAAIARFLRGEPIPQVQTEFILGFAGVWFLSDEAHLSTIAVRGVFQQQGAGECLLSGVIDLAIEHRAQLVTLEVRASNKSAQALYAKYGFVVVGIRPGYYSDNKEDAILMTADGITSSSFQDDFRRLGQANAQGSAPRLMV